MSKKPALLWLLAGLILLLEGCATPIGVTQADTQKVYRALTASVLSAGTPSEWSKQVLYRNNLYDRFKEEPAATLDVLRKLMQERTTPERLFALAELSFLHAEETAQKAYYLSAAAYAYAFLLPENEQSSIRGMDPRGLIAVDIYNLSIARGLASGDEVLLEPGTYRLPFGELTFTTDPAQFEWSGYRLKRFVSVGDYLIRGIRNRYRQPGAGAALAAELEPVGSGPAADAASKRIPPRTRVPVTAFLRFANPLRDVKEAALEARLELYSADQTMTVRVGERDVPLELDPTAALALQLETSQLWDFELAGFRFAEQKVFGDGLALMQPYRAGRIPVVFVHGTASSPARWAEMYNELANDPVLRDRYQFWIYQYNTGQPILYSAALMRRALSATLGELDPNHQDAALRSMVIIGHSQGGLLTKLMTVHSGTRFWDAASRIPLSELDAPAETKALLQEIMVFEPLPEVDRVVFIATPHRGSFRASGWVQGLMRRLIHLPSTLVDQSQSTLAQVGMTHLPTSIDNMSPNNHMVRTLADSPVDPRIKAHSIVAVKNPGGLPGQTDGVVAYESAHIGSVESELVVRSFHSVQGHPDAIEEVRRILRENLGKDLTPTK